MENEEDFRYIVKIYINEMADDEVLEAYKNVNYDKYKQLKYMRNYGKYILKERREW